MDTVAVYPGSFDPITNGHVDVVTRAAVVFDRVIVGVLANPRKAPLLDVETRIGLIRDALAGTAIVAGHRSRSWPSMASRWTCAAPAARPRSCAVCAR